MPRPLELLFSDAPKLDQLSELIDDNLASGSALTLHCRGHISQFFLLDVPLIHEGADSFQRFVSIQ